MALTVHTVGHGVQPFESFLELLRRADIERLVDVRRLPVSRRNPQYGGERLAEALAEHDVAYVHERDLGGFRRAVPDSPHTALAPEGFRGYADHMRTEPFARALSGVIRGADEHPTAVMCAEGRPERCHRRFLADALVARGIAVVHLLPGGEASRHELHPAARTAPGGRLIYDVAPVQGRLV